jgi:phosphoglycerate dehydrogenase-like enzyme
MPQSEHVFLYYARFFVQVNIVGFGAIGKELCKRWQGWGTQILAYDPTPDPVAAISLGAEAASWETLFISVDVISLHLPLLAATRRIVGKKEFAIMRNNAILINTSRGSVIDEQALVEALAKGEIGGAGLDVFKNEPLSSDSPLRAMSNVVLTPHIAGYTEESLLRIALQTTRNCLQALAREVTDHVVNREAVPQWKKRFAA